MIKDDFEELLTGMRPRLHRYCARMTGSAIDGEDVVQETLIKAFNARAAIGGIDNREAWLFRIAHNASLDFLRVRMRGATVPLSDDMEACVTDAPSNVVALGFQAFLQLPVLQRCAVILKDILGHSVEEIAAIADSTVPAAKSALQRGRQRLKELSASSPPPLSEDDREQLQHYVTLFQSGEFDAIRQMLAEDIRLDLIGRFKLQGRQQVDNYFTRYAQAGHWRYALGAVEGQLAMLVYDQRSPSLRPAHFVLLEWSAEGIDMIKDYLFAPYVLDEADWTN